MNQKEKPKYGIFSTVKYMVQLAVKYAPFVLIQVLLLVVLQMAMSMLQLFVVPVILGEIESEAALKTLFGTILFFTIGMMVVGALLTYINANTRPGRIELRSRIISDIVLKICRTGYSNLAKQDFLNQSQKARESTSSNWAATEAIWQTLYELLLNLLGCILYLILMMRLPVWILLLTVAAAVACYAVSAVLVQKDYRENETEGKFNRKLRYITEMCKDRLMAKDIRIFHMQEWLTQMEAAQIKELMRFYRKQCYRHLGEDFTNELTVLLRNAAAYIYLIGMVLNGSLQPAEFLLYFSAVTGFSGWVTGILQSSTTLKKQSADISQVMEFWEYEEPFLFEDGKPLPKETGVTYELELRNVSFRYPGADSDTLHHVNLKIAKGEKLAVVGRNGAGKTTLVKLLCGFYDPTEGEVLLNGQDIRQYDRRAYYRLFSAVFQDFSLLPGSIALNVAQSLDEIDMEKVKDCVRRAGLAEKIEALPQVYETKLGKSVYLDALELSGGETQRLMLARALYKEGAVIVLDEPTAALDPLAERDLYNRYHELTKGATSVYVSHRLASTRFCDRIILIGDGGIAEVGTHETLLAAGGEYAHLFEVQSQYYREGGDSDGE